MNARPCWQTTRQRVDLSRPRVMGIVNVTPDSFHDGGRHAGTRAAVAHCERLCAEGADLLDIGGESTRPGAAPVEVGEELARVLPVLREALKLGVPVSVDTRHAGTMRAVLDAGADAINDVAALRGEGALQALAAHPCAGVVLMHLQGEPATKQADPRYADVVAEVRQFLATRAAAARAAGVGPERIVVDPGIGFGKTEAHNVEMHQGLGKLAMLGFPVLVGWSRKSTLGIITGRGVDDRLAASVAAALSAACRGARLLRVHDVAATVDALKVWQALEPADGGDAHTTHEPRAHA